LAYRWVSKGCASDQRYALIALLHHALTAEEVHQVVAALTAEQSPALEDGLISHDEIGDMIAKLVEESPSEDDIRKVSARLAAAGWPLEGNLRNAE
jgi:Protein of unknown function (DUF3349)